MSRSPDSDLRGADGIAAATAMAYTLFISLAPQLQCALFLSRAVHFCAVSITTAARSEAVVGGNEILDGAQGLLPPRGIQHAQRLQHSIVHGLGARAALLCARRARSGRPQNVPAGRVR